MTTTIRAFVFRASMAWPNSSEPWCAVVAVSPDSTPTSDVRRIAWAGSHPEAMQAAYKLLADLDRELMDEVHASRANRHQCRFCVADHTVGVLCSCGALSDVHFKDHPHLPKHQPSTCSGFEPAPEATA